MIKINWKKRENCTIRMNHFGGAGQQWFSAAHVGAGIGTKVENTLWLTRTHEPTAARDFIFESEVIAISCSTPCVCILILNFGVRILSLSREMPFEWLFKTCSVIVRASEIPASSNKHGFVSCAPRGGTNVPVLTAGKLLFSGEWSGAAARRNAGRAHTFPNIQTLWIDQMRKITCMRLRGGEGKPMSNEEEN